MTFSNGSNEDYQKNGYTVSRKLFSKDELKEIRIILLEFHDLWKKDNQVFYSSSAVNSSNITSNKYLSEKKRERLFSFITSSKILDRAKMAVTKDLTFMNTQLFFNPVCNKQKNYWHRDPQYHLSIEEQKECLRGPEVIHLRIPLFDEPGIELIPGTHKRWDSKEELAVRLERNAKFKSDDLSGSLEIPLESGDLLIFSANMIHRGLYGRNRLAFDILLCEPIPSLIEHVDEKCLPSRRMLDKLDNADVFIKTIERIRTAEKKER